MFNKAFKEIIGHEGGYTNDPDDRGNWTTGIIGKGELKGTKYGIAAHSYPYLDIKNLTLKQAQDIYYLDFWVEAGIDKLPKHLQVSVFDSVINHGLRGGIRILQQAIGTLTDGIVGPNTIKASKLISEERFLLFRLNKYIDIILAKPALIKYINGWRNRVLKLLNDNL
jgi:lysozyme family protein